LRLKNFRHSHEFNNLGSFVSLIVEDNLITSMTLASEHKNKNYQGKDPMSPEKIISHEPTAPDRDQNDEEIAEENTEKRYD